VAGLARTCVLSLAVGGAFVVACGHLPFDSLNADAEGTGVPPDGGLDAAEPVDAPPPPPPIEDAGEDAGDAGCVGVACSGTFVSAAVGSDSNPGTAAKPLATISKAIAVASALGGKQNVVVAGGHYPEKVTLADGISLYGGFDCSARPCTWKRDVTSNDTVIVDQDEEGLLAPKSVSRKTLVDGFRILGKGGSVSGGAGSAAVTLLSGTPTISHCRVVGGDLTSGGNADSVGLAILGAPGAALGALLSSNTISGGASLSSSIGVLFDERQNGPQAAPPVAVVTGNTIRAGAAPLSVGVVARASGVGTTLKGNDIAGGASSDGASWGVSVQSTMTIDGNRINSDPNDIGTCTSSVDGSFCGGIQSEGSTTTIVNNVVFGAKAPRSCAVLLSDGDQVVGTVVLNANTLDGGGSGGDGTLSAAVALRGRKGTDVAVGSLRNNIFLGGANRSRFGIYEDGASGKTVRPTAIEFNDFWQATATKSDFAIRVWDGSVGTNLSFDNLGTIAAPTPSDNLSVDPLLTANQHLQNDSPVIDKGTSVEAPSRDIDGDKRPRGDAVDMGADEAK
jgi:hypothetical protein